jgi:hypothetical protein
MAKKTHSTYRYQSSHLELNHVRCTLYAPRQSLLSFQCWHQRKYLKPARREEVGGEEERENRACDKQTARRMRMRIASCYQINFVFREQLKCERNS